MKIVRSSEPVLFFSKKEKEKILHAIEAAEGKTSGEIRVHLERKVKDDIMAHAKEVFERMGMAKTERRNGVLIFMGVKSKRFVVIGDQGIHEQVPAGFWDEVVSEMTSCFRRDKFAEGLSRGILKIGEQLAQIFPHEVGDVNELSDGISYS